MKMLQPIKYEFIEEYVQDLLIDQLQSEIKEIKNNPKINKFNKYNESDDLTIALIYQKINKLNHAHFKSSNFKIDHCNPKFRLFENENLSQKLYQKWNHNHALNDIINNKKLWFQNTNYNQKLTILCIMLAAEFGYANDEDINLNITTTMSYADTIYNLQNQILNNPFHADDAFEMTYNTFTN